jgi:hypothetical protein
LSQEPLKHSLPLATAIDLSRWLEQDRVHPWAQRIARDRAIGANAPSGSNLDLALYWWSKVERGDDSADVGLEIERLTRGVTWVLVAAGVVSGVALTTTVCRYDGSAPINMLIVLGFLVVLPAFFTLLSSMLPLFSSKGMLATYNVGGVVAAFLSRRSAAAKAFFSESRSDVARDNVLRWQLMLNSQQFGLAFSLAALVTLLFNVALSDLAFGWSTTLELHADTVHGWLSVIASPWAWLWERAAPTLELVNTSRYFRLAEGTQGLSPENLTRWWTFLVASLLVYGVGLRAGALMFARLRSRKATEGLLLGHSEVTALFDRLRQPQVSTSEASAADDYVTNVPDAVRYAPPVGRDVLILWNGIDAPRDTDPASAPLANEEANSVFSSAHEQVLHAGGERDMNEDLAAIGRIVLTEGATVCIVTKAWEPPLLELHDYIEAIRKQVGAGVSIVVNPLGPQGSDPVPLDVDIWRRSIARLQDPGVYVT